MPGSAAKAENQERRRQKLTEFLKAEAADKGFDVCRITRPDAIPEAPARLVEFLDEGFHGTMEWLAETAERRSDPRTLWSNVRSVVMFGMNYGPEEDPRGILDQPDRGAISVYAQNRDYHDIIKGRLKEVATRFAARAGEDVKVFVDTAPVMESRSPKRQASAGKANTPISSAASSAPGCFSAACSPRRNLPSTPPSATIAAPVVPVSTPVPPLPSPPPTASTRGAAFPT